MKEYLYRLSLYVLAMLIFAAIDVVSVSHFGIRQRNLIQEEAEAYMQEIKNMQNNLKLQEETKAK